MEMGNAASSSSDCSSDSNNKCCEIRQLLPLEQAKSKVWEYFGFPTDNGEFSEKDEKKCFVSYTQELD